MTVSRTEPFSHSVGTEDHLDLLLALRELAGCEGGPCPTHRQQRAGREGKRDMAL